MAYKGMFKLQIDYSGSTASKGAREDQNCIRIILNIMETLTTRYRKSDQWRAWMVNATLGSQMGYNRSSAGSSSINRSAFAPCSARILPRWIVPDRRGIGPFLHLHRYF